MVPRALYRLLQCPTCDSRDLFVSAEGVHCARCRSIYARHNGYIDLMPRGAELELISMFFSDDYSIGEVLEYLVISRPLLSAGVRVSVL